MTHLAEMVNFDPNWYSNADELDRELFRTWLLKNLSNYIITVTFQKNDGTTRVMNCTLKSDIIPPTNPKENAVLCTVWDVESNAWRSFRFERIKKVDFEI